MKKRKEKERPLEPAIPSAYLNGLSGKRGFYLMCAALLGMLLLLFNQYIFSDKIFLFDGIGSDTVNGWWPEYFCFSNYIRHGGGIPTWTFSQGLGQNVFPAHMGGLPGALIYLFPPDKIPYVLAYIQMTKIFMGGIFFFLFLRKTGLSTYPVLIGTCLYAFSGFMIVGSTWYSFASEAYNVALLLLGFELLRKNNNLLVFPLAVASASVNPVHLYHDSLFLSAYLLFIYVKEGIDKRNLLLLCRAILLGALGLGMASFFVFGNFFQMLESPRGSGTVSHVNALVSQPIFQTGSLLYYKTFLLRMLSSDMAGYSNEYFGWYNYLEAPLQYCGLLTLLLIPQLFVVGGRKLKWLAGGSLFIAFLPVVFPYFRYAFWLFTGDYFRTYSLFCVTMMIGLAMITLDLIIRKRRANIPLLFITAFVLSAMAVGIDISNSALKIPVVVILILEAILIWYLVTLRNTKIVLRLLVIMVIAELLFISWSAVNDRDAISTHDLTIRDGYNDYTLEAVQYIKQRDKGFFRVHKDYASGSSKFLSINDAMMQGYYSSMSYHSFNQKNYVRFMQKMDLISDTDEAQTRWLGGVRTHPFLMELVSNKYFFSSDTDKYPNDPVSAGLVRTLYDSINKIEDVTILKNKFFLPLGFTYSKVISEGDMVKLGTHRDITMLRAVVVQESDMEKKLAEFVRFPLTDSINWLSMSGFDSLTNALKEDTLQISSFQEKHITGTIHNDKPKILFFSIPYDDGWNAEIDGKKVKPLMVNYGFLGFALSPGNHTVDLAFEPPYFKAGIRISSVSLFIFVLLMVWCGMQTYKRKNETTTIHA